MRCLVVTRLRPRTMAALRRSGTRSLSVRSQCFRVTTRLDAMPRLNSGARRALGFGSDDLRVCVTLHDDHFAHQLFASCMVDFGKDTDSGPNVCSMISRAQSAFGLALRNEEEPGRDSWRRPRAHDQFHEFSSADVQPMLEHQLTKVVRASSSNCSQWSSQCPDSNIQVRDPANSSGPNFWASFSKTAP